MEILKQVAKNSFVTASFIYKLYSSKQQARSAIRGLEINNLIYLDPRNFGVWRQGRLFDVTDIPEQSTLVSEK